MVSRLLNLFKRIGATSRPHTEEALLVNPQPEIVQKRGSCTLIRTINQISDRRGMNRAHLARQKNKAMMILEVVTQMKEDNSEDWRNGTMLLDREITILDMLETILVQLIESGIKIHQTYMVMKEDQFLTQQEKRNLKLAMRLVINMMHLVEGMTPMETLQLIREYLKVNQ
ncbi:C protein [Miniopterus schreibersii paramyxovirus]|uniref:C protein n=1 Tax=Miniopterus schreibersii paramyxovirus TaxID=1387879 RepID=UPI0003D87516|nr:C protein [Miniopterus schreibersii paramyxovirus]AGU69452.1 C protein [Miniopterus schreibersii paramyxovirus]